MINVLNKQTPAFKGYVIYNEGKQNNPKDTQFANTTFDQDVKMLNAIKDKLENDKVSIKNFDPIAKLQFADFTALVDLDTVHFEKGSTVHLSGEISSNDLVEPTEANVKTIDGLIASIRRLALSKLPNQKPVIDRKQPIHFPNLESAIDNILETIRTAIVEDQK